MLSSTNLNNGNENVFEENDGEPEDATVEQTTLQSSLQNLRLAVVVLAAVVGRRRSVIAFFELFSTFNGSTFREAFEFTTRTFPIQEKLFFVVCLQEFVDPVAFSRSLVENENVAKFEAVRQAPAKRPKGDDVINICYSFNLLTVYNDHLQETQMVVVIHR